MNISVVIAVANGKDVLPSCLGSLMQQLPDSCEVFVIDNGSSDGTPAFVRQHYPGVRVIQNVRNLGTAKARNQGIAASRGTWILTLDCDVVLKEGFLREL